MKRFASILTLSVIASTSFASSQRFSGYTRSGLKRTEMAEKFELYQSGISRLIELADLHSSLQGSSSDVKQHTKALMKAFSLGNFEEFTTFGSVAGCEACQVGIQMLDNIIANVDN